MKKIINRVERNGRYLQTGKNPHLLLLCKTHGDEFEVGECVDSYIEQNISVLPSLLYIPEVSPSATKLGTRKNTNGLDLNRNFFNDSPDNEVQFVTRLLANYKFETAISFHEDPELNTFYMYDAYGSNLEGTKALRKIGEEILSLGVGLLNGVDDPNDTALGDIFVNGYKHYLADKNNINPSSGFFADWSYSNGIIKRYLNPEIPGKLDLKTKEKIIEILFRHLILDQE